MNKYILFALIVYLIFGAGCASGYHWVDTTKKRDWMKPRTQIYSKSMWNYGQNVTPTPFPFLDTKWQKKLVQNLTLAILLIVAVMPIDLWNNLNLPLGVNG